MSALHLSEGARAVAGAVVAFADRVGPSLALSFVLFFIALLMFTYRPSTKLTTRVAQLDKKMQQLEKKKKTKTPPQTHSHDE